MIKDYQIIRNAVSLETCSLIKNSLFLAREILYLIHGSDKKFGDGQCPNSFSIHGQITTEALLKTFQPVVETVTSKKLFPTYSFGRIYNQGDELESHTDRPSCEYSATICIDNNPLPWEIFMQGERVILQPGDAVVYKGCEVIHWRETLTDNTEITQVFLHYVDSNGPYSEYKYDKRKLLGMPNA